jgi:hypothetical protein
MGLGCGEVDLGLRARVVEVVGVFFNVCVPIAQNSELQKRLGIRPGKFCTRTPKNKVVIAARMSSSKRVVGARLSMSVFRCRACGASISFAGL